MAINIMNPTKITDDVMKLYNLMGVDGKQFLKDYAKIVERLSQHWTGSDAVANQTDLANVYAEVTKLIKTLENLIIKVNNEEVYPLLRHIELSGGIGYKKEMGLQSSLGEISNSVSITKESNQSMTTSDIIQDASDFNGMPEKFETLKENLISAKNELFKNWLDGADLANIKSSFTSFENNVGSYIAQLKKVRDNLNIVAENKKSLL